MIYNEDCLETMARMPDNSIDSIITDPPYGILNHKIETQIDIPEFFKQAYRVLKPDSFLLYFGQQPTLTEWNSEAFKLFNYKSEIIWYKRQVSTPFGDISRVYENIMVVVKGKKQFNPVKRLYADVKNSLAEFIGAGTILKKLARLQQILKDRPSYDEAMRLLDNPEYTQTNTVNEAVTVPDKTKVETRIIRDLRTSIDGIKAQNLISFMPHNRLKYDMSGQGKGENNIKHPTVKSIELMKYLIELTAVDGGNVYDPFLGSGTTLVAIQELSNGEGLFDKKYNIEGIGSEIDKSYFDIAKERIR